jgi:hypothetical protein
VRPVHVPPPARVIAPLSDLSAPSWPRHGTWQVVHVGQSAVILAGPDDLLFPVTTRGRGLAPGGVSLPVPEDFDAVRVAALAAGGGWVDLAGWRGLPREAIHGADLGLVAAPVDRRAVDAMLAGLSAADAATDTLVGMDPGPFRALAPRLASAALAGDARGAGAVASRLVGAGPGATPAGDDVVVGVLAGLRVSAADDEAVAVLADTVRPLLARTTRASRHDLRAALAGEFSQHVHRLVRALRDVRLVAPALSAARTWGATSGLDLAAGLAWSLDVAHAHVPDAGRVRDPGASGLVERRCA